MPEYLLYTLKAGSQTEVVRATPLDDKEAALQLKFGLGAGEKLVAIAAAVEVLGRKIETVTLNAAGNEITALTYEAAKSAKYMAAIALHDGLIAFREYVLQHAAGVPKSAVDKVLAFLWQAHRAAHLIVRGQAAGINLTDAQIVAWCTSMRYGPKDTSVITELGVYDQAGLFEIFEKAEAAGAPATPAGPITWVDTDTANWTADDQGNANAVPKRFDVSEIETIDGAVTKYLDVYSRSWLDGV